MLNVEDQAASFVIIELYTVYISARLGNCLALGSVLRQPSQQSPSIHTRDCSNMQGVARCIARSGPISGPVYSKCAKSVSRPVERRQLRRPGDPCGIMRRPMRDHAETHAGSCGGSCCRSGILRRPLLWARLFVGLRAVPPVARLRPRGSLKDGHRYIHVHMHPYIHVLVRGSLQDGYSEDIEQWITARWAR